MADFFFNPGMTCPAGMVHGGTRARGFLGRDPFRPAQSARLRGGALGRRGPGLGSAGRVCDLKSLIGILLAVQVFYWRTGRSGPKSACFFVK